MVALPYQQVWVADCEFIATNDADYRVLCLVAMELQSGRTIRLWEDGLHRRKTPPFPVDKSSLFIAFNNVAEYRAFLSLGWPLPQHAIDLYVEFLRLVNGRKIPVKRNLLGALSFFQIANIGDVQKDYYRNLILSGGPWSETEIGQILSYCQEDVQALKNLFPKMMPHILKGHKNSSIALGRAMLRARYMAAVAKMERAGIPIDRVNLDRLTINWESLKTELIQEVNKDYGVYENNVFKNNKFENFLKRQEIVWPRTEKGNLCLSRETFREMARSHPIVAPLHETRNNISELRLTNLQVGNDSRNRTSLFPFRSRTARNTPSATKYIFAPSVWIRSLIKPFQNSSFIYADWSAQEIAIGACLSNDQALQNAYLSGDVYLSFAKMAGLVPQDATPQSHKAIRDKCKAIVLGTNYGMGFQSLANRLGIQPSEAKFLMDKHRETFLRYWEWAEAHRMGANLLGYTETTLGWRLHVSEGFRPNSLLNFPMQAHGSHMMQLGACLATEDGLRISGPIHDALAMECRFEDKEDHIQRLKRHMEKASEVLLDGFTVRVDVSIVDYPHRYQDPRGVVMWQKVKKLLNQVEAKKQNERRRLRA